MINIEKTMFLLGKNRTWKLVAQDITKHQQLLFILRGNQNHYVHERKVCNFEATPICVCLHFAKKRIFFFSKASGTPQNQKKFS